MNKTKSNFTIEESDFKSEGVRCSGLLYRPAGKQNAPIVVMAHGMAAEKSFRLPAYAERFASAGIAVLVFDYRCFGESDGEPRNLVNPYRHVRDYQAAIAHARALPGIDAERIAVWGTSFAGGHVLVAAAREQGIKAVISQVPAIDPLATIFDFPASLLLRWTLAGWRDLFRKLTFRKPYHVQMVGEPGELAVLNVPGAKEGYYSIKPAESTWNNLIQARLLLYVAFYRPIRHISKLSCPVLLLFAEHDEVIPLKVSAKAAARAKKPVLKVLPIKHFEAYIGAGFEKVVEIETEFLIKELAVADG